MLDIVGNSLVIKSMQRGILANRIAHSYIIDGISGSGKTYISKKFAKTVLCKNKSINSCNECKSCISFDSNNHPDVFYIDLNKKKSIGVTQIREEILSKVDIKAYLSEYKIFIVKNAETLTPQSQNSLLKTIEEPSSNCIFIFLSENINNLLKTFISRCIIYKLEAIKDTELKKYLKMNYELEREYLNLIIRYSDGSIGKAKNIINDDSFINFKNEFISIGKDIKDKDISETLVLVKDIQNFEEKIIYGLDILALWYRDILIYKETKVTQNLICQELLDDIKEEADILSTKKLLKNLDVIYESKIYLTKNSNVRLTIEVMLLELRGK